MKKIKLTQGKYALVDNSDYEQLIPYNWSTRRIKQCFYAFNFQAGYMHRFILELTDGNVHVDHKDGDGLNNQRNNIRTCTHVQNCNNKKSQINSSSKYLGVSWDAGKNKWRSQIKVNGKIKYLGAYTSEIEGAIIYNITSRRYRGEFAGTNKF